MNIKLLTETSRIPTRATPGSACWDVYANERFALLPGERALVKLGFALEVPEFFEVQIRPRSGLALKQGILVHLGTIDSDYRGEIGDRIAQMALCPALREELVPVAELTQTSRGTGGFGHSGV